MRRDAASAAAIEAGGWTAADEKRRGLRQEMANDAALTTDLRLTWLAGYVSHSSSGEASVRFSCHVASDRVCKSTSDRSLVGQYNDITAQIVWYDY